MGEKTLVQTVYRFQEYKKMHAKPTEKGCIVVKLSLDLKQTNYSKYNLLNNKNSIFKFRSDIGDGRGMVKKEEERRNTEKKGEERMMKKKGEERIRKENKEEQRRRKK